MAAKDGAGRVFEVTLAVVADLPDNALLLCAGAVAGDGAVEPSATARVGRDLARVAAQKAYRRAAAQDRQPVFADLRRLERAAHPLDIGHGAARILLRKPQPEVVPRLQQDAPCLLEALTHRAIGRLPEVAALGVLEMRAAGEQRDAQVGNGRAGQDAGLRFFHQVRQNEPLPAPRQNVLAANRVEAQSAARLTRLQQKMHLGIVPQRLIMPHALDRRCDRLKINDVPRVK